MIDSIPIISILSIFVEAGNPARAKKQEENVVTIAEPGVAADAATLSRSRRRPARPAVLHGYFRSSAAWRVRIALNLKGLQVTHVAHHLRRGEQRAPDYLALNPQGLVPALALDDGTVLTQSLAIIEWLDETFPKPPLLPADALRPRAGARRRAGVRRRHPSFAEPEGAGATARRRLDRRRGARPGRQMPTTRDCRPPKPSSRSRPVRSASAPRRASPTSASCRSSPARGASAWTSSAFPRLLAAEAARFALPAFADAAPGRQADAE